MIDLRAKHLDAVKKILADHVSGCEVRVFGSRVTGKGNDRSDIDVGIEGPEEIPSRIIIPIKEEIEALPTLYKIDVVDFSRISEGFRKVAQHKIEALI